MEIVDMKIRNNQSSETKQIFTQFRIVTINEFIEIVIQLLRITEEGTISAWYPAALDQNCAPLLLD